MHLLYLVNDTPPTDIYTLSLHDALPICDRARALQIRSARQLQELPQRPALLAGALLLRRGSDHQRRRALAKADRKSTRLNSSHLGISYAVFCLKKKTK